MPLRLHLAELLLGAGRADEAVSHLGTALQQRPEDEAARQLMRRAIQAQPPPGGASVEPSGEAAAGRSGEAAGPSGPAVAGPSGEATLPPPPATSAEPGDGQDMQIDWTAYEEELSDAAPPRFATPAQGDPDPVDPETLPRDGSSSPPPAGPEDRTFDVERPQTRWEDVGGMSDVKQRLELAFLGPLRNPHLQRLYGKSLRGGLLLYGPPGCGKTFIARAVAGELGARFISVSVNDVLDMWLGNSERNLHELFAMARRNAPCVVFLDEVDALGMKRSQAQSIGIRTTINQLLAEMDGADDPNDGVFVLAATNAPWDVDPALRRPGRLDRMMLVLPPDRPAREAVLRYHLRDRPLENIDLARIVKATEHFSGADLAHVCNTAAEYAMHDSITSGEVRMMRQVDFDRALTEIRPSTGTWLDAARNVAMFANTGGDYDPLVTYLRARKLL